MADPTQLADQRRVVPDTLISVPTMVQAMQWTRPNRAAVLHWLHDEGATYWTTAGDEMSLSVVTVVHHVDLRLATPQGVAPVLPGNWVVRGVFGEWYPIADKVRERRYRHRPTTATEDALGLVRQATGEREAAEQQWRAAIRAAATAATPPCHVPGCPPTSGTDPGNERASVAAVARAAGVTPPVVRQLLHDGGWR